MESILKTILGVTLLAASLLALVLAGFYIVQRRLVYFSDMTRGDADVTSNFELLRPDGVHLRGWWVASRRPVAKLVLVTPFDSLGKVAKVHYPRLPVDLLLRERYDSADWLRGRREPTLVLRASDDRVVPAANTDALLAALPPTTQVVAIESSHDSLSASPTYGEALAAFLR